MLKEEYLDLLLKELYKLDTLDVYDYTATNFAGYGEVFPNTRSWADQLVKDKLAKFVDGEHTVLHISNYGRYWMMNGGYLSFLKDEHSSKEHKHIFSQQEMLLRKEKEDLLEARLKLTRYRLVGFWLTVVISAIGFLLSLFNLYMIMKGRK